MPKPQKKLGKVKPKKVLKPKEAKAKVPKKTPMSGEEEQSIMLGEVAEHNALFTKLLE